MLSKKELKKQYKQTLPPMGVYKIINISNGKIFIGSAKNVNGKINSSKFQLENGSHVNKELRDDFIKFGKEKFNFEVIDTLEPKEEPDYDYTEDLKTLGEMWIDKLKPHGETGYNKIKDI